MIKLPQTEIEAIRYFADEDIAIRFVADQRWANGVICPTCGRVDVSYLKTQKHWQCKSRHAKRQFSVKTGTIFEDSPLLLGIWLAAVWRIVNSKNGVSSYELASSLGITQKSAWFVGHRIREALKAGCFVQLSDTVQGDETYVGGRHNPGPDHKHSFDNKIAIVGLVEQKKGTGRTTTFVTKTASTSNTVSFISSRANERFAASNRRLVYKTLVG